MLFRSERYPESPVVVFSAAENDDNVMRAVDAGARGFIPKSLACEELVGAIKSLLEGGIYLPGELVSVPAPATRSYGMPEITARDIGLTERQAQVLALLVQGKPNKVICRELNLAEGTVKIHVTAILSALKVQNRTQAVIAASKIGLRLP